MPPIVDAEPVLIQRLEAFRLIGVGTTKGQELINAGLLDARKLGTKTLVTTASIRAFVEALPPCGGGSVMDQPLNTAETKLADSIIKPTKS
jgi:hypothetical protein